MKLIATAFGVLFGLSLVSPKAEAFSDGFKKYAASVQGPVMLKGQHFSAADAKKFWEKFDEEIISLISQSKKAEDLDKAGAAEELTYLDAKGGEQEILELGTIEAKFFDLDGSGKTWLVALSNSMYAGSDPLPTSTVHIYREKDGKFQVVGALDAIKGPWDADKTLFSNIQVQVIRQASKLGAAEFATFHKPASKSGKVNRSQIVWDFDSILHPVMYFPEVDYHTVGGQQVAGRGDPVLVQ